MLVNEIDDLIDTMNVFPLKKINTVRMNKNHGHIYVTSFKYKQKVLKIWFNIGEKSVTINGEIPTNNKQALSKLTEIGETVVSYMFEKSSIRMMLSIYEPEVRYWLKPYIASVENAKSITAWIAILMFFFTIVAGCLYLNYDGFKEGPLTGVISLGTTFGMFGIFLSIPTYFSAPELRVAEMAKMHFLFNGTLMLSSLLLVVILKLVG